MFQRSQNLRFCVNVKFFKDFSFGRPIKPLSNLSSLVSNFNFFVVILTRTVRSKDGDETIKIAKNKNPVCQEFPELDADWSFFHEGYVIDFRVEKTKPHTTEVSID